MEKHILQYFVFNEAGTDILEGNAFILDSEAELNDLATTLISNYHSDPDLNKLGLVLMNNTTGKMLFDSNEEK